MNALGMQLCKESREDETKGENKQNCIRGLV